MYDLVLEKTIQKAPPLLFEKAAQEELENWRKKMQNEPNKAWLFCIQICLKNGCYSKEKILEELERQKKLWQDRKTANSFIMRFILKNKNSENIANIMRQIGYKLNIKAGQLAFIRPIYHSGYPRFHIYLEEKEEKVVINLHLDQKQPSYKGQTAHSADYQGDVLLAESQRIKSLWQK